MELKNDFSFTLLLEEIMTIAEFAADLVRQVMGLYLVHPRHVRTYLTRLNKKLVFAAQGGVSGVPHFTPSELDWLSIEIGIDLGTKDFESAARCLRKNLLKNCASAQHA